MSKGPSRREFLTALLVGAAAACGGGDAVAAEPGGDGRGGVRLVLQVTVDGLRADALGRVLERLPPGGFRRWIDEGTTVADARYGHATTFTAVGHATLATGAYPAQHGIVANDWYDRESGASVYCVGDPSAPLVGAGVDPGPSAGRSPRNLIGTTFSDELVLASGGASRAFSVSGKDRGAILLGGHLGRAAWYDPPSGRFVTSAYYGSVEPAWLADFAESGAVERYREAVWTLLAPREGYRALADDRPYERGIGHLGTTFPRALATEDVRAFRSILRFTPFLDELVGELAGAVLVAEDLGRGASVDYLAVSFSASDYVQHAFGPESLEAEDQLLRLDRTLARLLAQVDARVGREQVVLVLAADHGFDRIPERYLELGMDAGRIDPSLLLPGMNAALRARFGVEGDLVRGFANPAFYLDGDAVAAADLAPAIVEEAVAAWLRRQPGVAQAVARSRLVAGAVSPDDPVLAAVERSFHAPRSGDVMVVQLPLWFLYPDVETFSAMHGSPYAYDTRVPIAFSGPGIAHAVVERRVTPASVAPTIAAYLGISPPVAAVGEPLPEVRPPPCPASLADGARGRFPACAP